MLARGLAGLVLLAAPLAGAAASDDLARTCQRLRGGDNPWFGAGTADELRADLAATPDDLELASELGAELLLQGDTAGAIAHLSSVVEALGASPKTRPTIPEWNLALAHLQRAEDQNCVHHEGGAQVEGSTSGHSPRRHRSGDSCIFPVSPAAVHGRPEHARAAGDLFQDMLEAGRPDGAWRHRAAWLLNVARRLTGDFPDGVPARFRIDDEPPDPGSFPAGRWRNLAPELGVDALDLAGGAIADDFDNDGVLDLVTSTWDPCGSLKAFRGDGKGGYVDVTEAWGLAGQLGGLNLMHADHDGDGRLDLFVLRGAWLLEEGRIRNSLLRNELGRAGGSFVDVTAAAGLATPAYPTQAAAWADHDGDGDLDLYVANEASEAHAYPSQLFENLGGGTFRDIAEEAGVTNVRYAKGVAWGDVDNDGDPDLYVSNFGANRLYLNDGGIFRDVAVRTGVTEPERESFATWFFDFDNDGDLDLYVGDYRNQAAEVVASYLGVDANVGQPLLYRNDCGPEAGCGGRLRMTEVSRELGIRRPALPMGANFGDLDNDGWLDFYLGTGEPDLASLMPNLMYRFDGTRFHEVTFAGGFGHLQKGHGVAFADLDRDGDMDLLHQLGGFYPTDTFGNALFENPGNDNAWVTLRFEGIGPAGGGANRFGIGSRVAVTAEGPSGGRTIHRVVGSGGSFGGNSMQLEVGLGDADRIVEVRVRWAGSSREQTFVGIEPRAVYLAVEGKGELEPVETAPFRLGGNP